LQYDRPILERTGVVHYNNDGHHFISTKYLFVLQIDAIRQLAERGLALKLEIAMLKEAKSPCGRGNRIDFRPI
jgi:hypothetical protein